MCQKFKLTHATKLCFILLIALVTSCSKGEVVTDKETIIDIIEDDDPVDDTSSNNAPTDGTCTPNKHGQYYKYTDLVPGGMDVNATQVSATATIDDRTCFADYFQKEVNGRTVGVYKIADGTNNLVGDKNQPRMERASRRITSLKKGSFVEISGFVTINKVGYVKTSFPRNSMKEPSGTYFIQAKGKHEFQPNPGGDPAILLLLAKPVFNSDGSTKHFEVYREQINYREGCCVDGRTLVYVTDIQPGVRTPVLMRIEFTEDFQQTIIMTVGSVTGTFEVPNTEVIVNGETKTQIPKESKIRFGAYRIKGGEAEIYWDTVKQSYLEK
jgi:hypothetical protein